MEQPLTEMKWVKVPLTDEEKIVLATSMADAEARITGKNIELEDEAEAFKTTKKQLEGEISTFSMELHTHAENYRKGYTEVKKECFVTYDGNRIIFTEKGTGEIVEERDMTETEQIKMARKR